MQLRPVEASDLETLFEHQRDEAACRMARFESRQWDRFSAHWNKILADPSVDNLAVVVDDQVVGNVVAWNQHDRRLIGYWIGRAFWNRGIATEALALYLQMTERRPLSAFVAPHNLGSIRVLQKCGFTRCDPESAEKDHLFQLW